MKEFQGRGLGQNRGAHVEPDWVYLYSVLSLICLSPQSSFFLFLPPFLLFPFLFCSVISLFYFSHLSYKFPQMHQIRSHVLTKNSIYSQTDCEADLNWMCLEPKHYTWIFRTCYCPTWHLVQLPAISGLFCLMTFHLNPWILSTWIHSSGASSHGETILLF